MRESINENHTMKEAHEKYVRKIIKMSDEHFKKYGSKKMTLKELDQLCGLQ